ncbi:MAG: F0F1 ATP synthase subunit B [Prevotellaceae bacterium]|jgi:F-type H+-transporting ATPase subunit b|nr:F0F1 ATP synthase subunit B [Prevotellaceae bacterium]
MSLLIPDTGLLFWMALSFGIVFFVLAKFGFPVIIGAVEKRSSYIEKALEDARVAEEKLATLGKQAEDILAKAHGERSVLISEAHEIKNKIVGEAKDAAEAEARKRLSRAAAEIEETRSKALGRLREQVADISVKIAGKVIEKELQGDEKQLKLINRLLDEEIVNKA